MPATCFLGCASWSLPLDVQERFPGEGQHLHRYAARFPAVEINSSFHRPHSRATYERWAASVPADFRFAVKLPKAITHERKLQGCESLVDTFMLQTAGLGDRLGCLLVQLPPSLAFQESIASAFFDMLRERWPGAVSAEPRHASWFDEGADGLLARYEIARVLADPVRHAAGERPGGWRALTYLRLHGTPRTYFSSYPDSVMQALARRIGIALRGGETVWCIFDNTASGAATHNALALMQSLEKEPA